MFDRLGYVITGFLQDRGTRSRLVELWYRAHAQFCDDLRGVFLRSWASDWAAEAEFAFRLSREPRITIIGYSWGAGWGAMQLARQLGRRGLSVETMALIDPVYRHPYLLGQWRAFLPIPRNVRRVISWRQQMNQPRGHKLIAEGATTRIDPPIVVSATHENMDDQPVIVDRCFDVLKRGML